MTGETQHLFCDHVSKRNKQSETKKSRCVRTRLRSGGNNFEPQLLLESRFLRV